MPPARLYLSCSLAADDEVTLAKNADVPIRIGPIAKMATVSRQLAYKPTDKPAMNVATYCTTMLNLLPIPSLTRSKSLKMKVKVIIW